MVANLLFSGSQLRALPPEGGTTNSFSEVKAMSTNSSEISLLLDQYREGQAEAFGKLMALACWGFCQRP